MCLIGDSSDKLLQHKLAVVSLVLLVTLLGTTLSVQPRISLLGQQVASRDVLLSGGTPPLPLPPPSGATQPEDYLSSDPCTQPDVGLGVSAATAAALAVTLVIVVARVVLRAYLASGGLSDASGTQHVDGIDDLSVNVTVHSKCSSTDSCQTP